MATLITSGVRVVYGIPKELKPIKDAPDGIRRFKFRNTDAGRVFIKNGNITRHFILLDRPDHWGLMEQGLNLKSEIKPYNQDPPIVLRAIPSGLKIKETTSALGFDVLNPTDTSPLGRLEFWWQGDSKKIISEGGMWKITLERLW